LIDPLGISIGCRHFQLCCFSDLFLFFGKWKMMLLKKRPKNQWCDLAEIRLTEQKMAGKSMAQPAYYNDDFF
jgi:hypothetical protein